MAQIRGLLLTVLLVATFYTTFAEEDEGFGTEVRFKRDVLKGKNGHDLVRSKRYIGRVPVAYMKKVNFQPFEEDNLASGNSKQPVSHFREFLQTHQTSPTGGEEIRQIPEGMSKSHHQARRYIPSFPKESNDETSKLTNEEIQTLLLMLDGYGLNNAVDPRNVRPENYYSVLSPRAGQMYEVGKRETGKRSIRNYEQPMNFDNSFYPEPAEDKLEFLNGGRSKRTGARHLMVSSRVKKETDPASLSSLDRVFSDDNTNLVKEKTKKAIDWSNYFGVDKRSNGKVEKVSKSPTTITSQQPTTSTNNPKPAPTNPISTKSKLVAVPLTSTTKTSKKDQERKENETGNKNKEAVDREWMLQEFYKNFAMMTNVKRKREVPSIPRENELAKLDQLEKQMTQVGDKIIWDALKYTGAHRDADMTPGELAKVKADIIDKLSTAYSLEKVKEAVEELRQKIAALNNTQP